MRNIFSLYKEGLVTQDEIDDAVDEWHKLKNITLSEYLGMTPDEYDKYVRNEPLPKPHYSSLVWLTVGYLGVIISMIISTILLFREYPYDAWAFAILAIVFYTMVASINCKLTKKVEQ